MRDRQALRSIGIEVPEHVSPDAVDVFIRDSSGGFDIVILSDLFVAHRYLEAVQKLHPQSRIVFDTVDLHYLREYREARLKKDRGLLEKALRTRDLELAIARTSDQVWTVSPEEEQTLRNDGIESPIHCIPDVFDVLANPAPFDARKDILFIGAFDHGPNLDAVRFLSAEIFPRLRTRVRDISLDIVGANPPDEVKALEGDGIRVRGFVEDLDSMLDRARLSVAPLRFGAGIKGKVLMSLAHGLPVVGSAIAAEGLPQLHMPYLLVADHAASFAEGIVSLYADRACWRTFSANGQRMIGESFSEEAMIKRLGGLF